MILLWADLRTGQAPRTGCWLDEGAVPSDLASAVALLGGEAWPVNLVLVDDARMEELNREFRDAEGVTDVLSFSYLADTGQGAPDLAAGDRGARRNLWREDAEAEDVVGEIILAPAFVTGRCREEGWPVEAEFALLVVHGCLHLLGWEHDDRNERRLMRELEAEVLGSMGLAHPLG